MAIVEVSIVFEAAVRIGPDAASLLESIRESGSISAAARRVGMPYKKAWMLLDSLNQAFTEPVIKAAPGGAGGGGATLTPFGTQILKSYQRVAWEAADLLRDDVAAIARKVRPNVGWKE